MNLKSKLVIFFMVLSIPMQSFGACDFSKDIQENADGTYKYTRDCHVEVGKRVRRLVLVEQQVVELEKTIELKDLALVKQKERADLWMDASFKINDKLQSYDSAASKNQWLYFGLGVAATALAVWGAGQLR